MRYAAPTAVEYVMRLTEQGVSADFIAVQKMIYRVARMNVSAFPNRSIRRLTGAPAPTFTKFAEREKSAWTRSSR